MSSSAFILPTDFTAEWRDITLVHSHSHSRVYTATRYGRRFLLKALAPEDEGLTDFRLQQEQEFRLGVQLVHPNIAATYSLEQVEGVGRCIVQEWVDGMTIGEWLRTNPSLAARERVFGQLLDALEYVHGFQLVHHDLKPDNILVTRNGTNVKLIDFGLSATDATLSPVSNDMRDDIQALGKLLPLLLPRRKHLAFRCRNGQYGTIAAIRRAIDSRKRFFRLLPGIVSVILLLVASVVFYLSWHERHYGVDILEIQTALDDIYRPVYDSLSLPDAAYQDVAKTYIYCVPKPMQEYERMIARYPVGSIQHTLFQEAWLSIYNKKINDLDQLIKDRPYSKIAYGEGRILYEECLRLEQLQQAVVERHK